MSDPARRGEVTPLGAEGWLFAALGVHLLASAAHGVVHGVVPVPVPEWLLLAVVCSLFVLPLAGVSLVATGRRLTGTWLVLTGTLCGALLEAVAHFAVVTPDHVSQTAHAAFGPTALASTAGSALAAVTAGWYLRRHRHGGDVRSAIDSRT